VGSFHCPVCHRHPFRLCSQFLLLWVNAVTFYVKELTSNVETQPHIFHNQIKFLLVFIF
jgi:hypothetical protein